MKTCVAGAAEDTGMNGFQPLPLRNSQSGRQLTGVPSRIGKTTDDEMAWSGKDVESVGTEAGPGHEKDERCQG